MNKRHVNKWISWLMVFVWMGLIFYLSNQQGSESSGLSSGLLGVIIDIVHTILPFIPIDADVFHHFFRKSAHFMAYLILGLLIMNAIRSHTYKRAGLALIIGISYAITDEVHQLFITGRSGEVRDVLIDATGIAAGIGVYFLVRILFTKVFVKQISDV